MKAIILKVATIVGTLGVVIALGATQNLPNFKSCMHNLWVDNQTSKRIESKSNLSKNKILATVSATCLPVSLTAQGQATPSIADNTNSYSENGYSESRQIEQIGTSEYISIKDPFSFFKNDSYEKRVSFFFSSRKVRKKEKIGSPDDPVIPLDLLASMVSDDPWMGALSGNEGNPFTHAISQNDTKSSSEVTDNSTVDDSSNEDVNDSSDQNTTPQDEPTNDNNDSNPNSNNNGPSVNSDKPKPEVILFWSAPDGQHSRKVYMLDHNLFQINRIKNISIDYISMPVDSHISFFYIVDDYNGDGLSDVLRVDKVTGMAQIILNSYYNWSPCFPFTFSKTPKSGTWMRFFDPRAGNLAIYSQKSASLDIFQYSPDGVFNEVDSLFLSAFYDGIVGTDFTGDGYDDLVLLNMNRNVVTYLINDCGQALTPVSSNPPKFDEPLLGRFYPEGEGAQILFHICKYNGKSVIYIVKDYIVNRFFLEFGRLSPNVCIMLGDFNNDGTLDIGFGHIVG